MSKIQFQLSNIKFGSEHSLQLSFADGKALTVNLRPWINNNDYLAPLIDLKFFQKAVIGENCRYISWPNTDIEIASDNLRNLGIEQAGGIGHERIWNWLYESGLNLKQAAEAIGISRRMLIYYRDGEKPIPLTVWLACLGWNSQHTNRWQKTS